MSYSVQFLPLSIPIVISANGQQSVEQVGWVARV